MKVPKKIDINQVFIAPLYKCIDKDYIDIFLCNLEYRKLDQITCLYKDEFGYFYDLSKGRDTEIKTIHRYFKIGDNFIVPENITPLIDFIETPDYKLNKIQNIKYKDLLYIIEPIMADINWQVNNSHYQYMIDDNNLYVGPIYLDGNRYEDIVVCMYKYFALSKEKGMPISYKFIHRGILHLNKKELKPYKQKTLTK